MESSQHENERDLFFCGSLRCHVSPPTVFDESDQDLFVQGHVRGGISMLAGTQAKNGTAYQVHVGDEKRGLCDAFDNQFHFIQTVQ